MSRPHRDGVELLVDTGKLLSTLELTLAELRIFAEELREEIEEMGGADGRL